MMKLLLPLIVLALPVAAWAQDTAAAGESAQPISRAEFLRQMDAEFARLDEDGSRFVTAEEIVASQRAAAQAEALRQNQAVFAGLDRDGNGALSAEEFAALANPGAIPIDAAPLMQQFDRDKDGTITLIEYRISTQANFDRIDSDRDGVVTQVEMRAAGIAPQ